MPITPMRLLAPDERCSGSYRKSASLWGVCIRCARLHPKARQQLGTVYISDHHGQRVADCREVLFDGSHAAHLERQQQIDTSLLCGGGFAHSVEAGHAG